MTTIQKNEILNLVLAEKDRLGSFSKVATKAGISPATISQLANKNWELIADEMWYKIAAALGFKPENDWAIVETTNTMIIWQTLNDARNNGFFVAISEKAGSGKTASLRTYETANKNNSVFYIQCREWARKDFLLSLAKTLGIETGKVIHADDLLMQVVQFFKQRSTHKPLLLVDEADKLKAPAMRAFITLYNECEGELAVVIAGTNHLQKQMQRDARYDKKGAEELMSRFGRRFISLPGATESDVAKICVANQITDKGKHKMIFTECQPVRTFFSKRNMEVVEDLRRLKRIVQREILKLHSEYAVAAT